jgi:hypothetical protein
MKYARLPRFLVFPLIAFGLKRDAIFLDSSFNLSSDKFHYLQNSRAGRGGATVSPP